MVLYIKENRQPNLGYLMSKEILEKLICDSEFNVCAYMNIEDVF